MPFPFSLWRCGRLICVRRLFADANSCLCQIATLKMNFQSQSAKSNNLRLQQPLLVCSNLRRSLERGCYWKSFPLSVFRFPFSVWVSSLWSFWCSENRRQLGNSRLFFCLISLNSLISLSLAPPLIAHTCRYYLAQSKISCLKKFFLIESKEIKNVYICDVKWHKKPQDRHIESVFCSPNLKIWQFLRREGNE